MYSQLPAAQWAKARILSQHQLTRMIMKTLPNYERKQQARNRYDYYTFMAGGERLGIAPAVTLGEVLGIKSTADKSLYNNALRYYARNRVKYVKRVANSKAGWTGPDGKSHLVDPEEVPSGVSSQLDRWRQISTGKASG